jgi:hypothetical protein
MRIRSQPLERLLKSIKQGPFAAVTILAIAWVAGPAQAASVGLMDSRQLLAACGQTDGPSATCTGYVAGVSDVLRDLHQADEIATAAYCPGPGQTVADTAAVVVSWLRSNPHRLGESAATAIIIALHESHPCRQE